MAARLEEEDVQRVEGRVLEVDPIDRVAPACGEIYLVSTGWVMGARVHPRSVSSQLSSATSCDSGVFRRPPPPPKLSPVGLPRARQTQSVIRAGPIPERMSANSFSDSRRAGDSRHARAKVSCRARAFDSVMPGAMGAILVVDGSMGRYLAPRTTWVQPSAPSIWRRLSFSGFRRRGREVCGIFAGGG